MCHPKWHVGRGNAIPNGMFPPGSPFKNPPHTVSWEGPQNRASIFCSFSPKFAPGKTDIVSRQRETTGDGRETDGRRTGDGTV